MKRKKIIKVERDPKYLVTEKIQVWNASGTFLYLTEKDNAKKLLESGSYGVSSGQSIFELCNSKYFEYV